MQVTSDQMDQLFPGSGRFADSINKTANNYSIQYVPMFVAQIGYESDGLKVFEENLHYSAERLLQVFPRYFNASNVNQYVDQPEKIANRIYANRMGNGDEASGDGWNYRGRGAIQTTGKNNYLLFAQDVGMTLDQVVAYMQTDEGAIMSAGFFWYNNNIDSVGDDITAVTKKINGGTNGLAQRQTDYLKAQQIFAQ